jgi:hypothetical protein
MYLTRDENIINSYLTFPDGTTGRQTRTYKKSPQRRQWLLWRIMQHHLKILSFYYKDLFVIKHHFKNYTTLFTVNGHVNEILLFYPIVKGLCQWYYTTLSHGNDITFIYPIGRWRTVKTMIFHYFILLLDKEQ